MKEKRLSCPSYLYTTLIIRILKTFLYYYKIETMSLNTFIILSLSLILWNSFIFWNSFILLNSWDFLYILGNS